MIFWCRQKQIVFSSVTEKKKKKKFFPIAHFILPILKFLVKS